MRWVGSGLDVRSVSSSVRTMGAERREDVLLAGVIGLAGLVEVALGAVPGHAVVASLSLLVMTAALMVRRLRPRLCLTLVLLALTVQSFLGVPVSAQLMMNPFILVAAYSVGAHLDRRASAIGLAIGATLVSVAIAATGSGGSDYGFGLLLVTGPWIAGVLVRARSAAEAEAVADAQSRARRAADDERERIARELHDIVSHGLSAMVVQAAAAAELIDHSPEDARKAMHEVQTTGAAAMIEMRHMLGLMRGGEAAGRRPQPALEDVQELVATEQAAGHSVSLSVEGAPRELPRGLALSIFRIVQESLTNVRKHASGSRCEVIITYTPVALEVEIVDDGGGRPQRPESPGFGIIGMSERARLYGGALEAGPRSPGGGWVVRGGFPLEHHVVES
ncbi:sensor histidine kinase [Ornithinimicrobium cryptoxanthini]|uniref:sensor histidine kinase n=1 Tax=Ornithinimicrobium cryptoxanthini TaxID=2934161 RepID=UPI0021189127|nr:sensor histidine kinase [Ornithinimicrobium cryptoxanthini]